MPNSLEHAKKWLNLISEQNLPLDDIFKTHLAAGEITFLCNCGCHGFGFAVPENAALEPLTKGAGLYCQIAFESDANEEINILLFANSQGYFTGADVNYGANVEPMPDIISPVSLKGIWSSNLLSTI